MARSQQQRGQLVFGEVAEHVTLVLLVVGAANEKVNPVAGHYPGVVAVAHRVEAESSGPLEEQVEFDVTVALDTRFGERPAAYASMKGATTWRSNSSV